MIAAAGAGRRAPPDPQLSASPAIYPGGGDLGRVIIHAVIVVIESAGLIAMGEVIRRAFIGSEAALQAAAQAQAQAEGVMREVEGLRATEQRSAEDRRASRPQALAEQIGDGRPARGASSPASPRAIYRAHPSGDLPASMRGCKPISTAR